MTTEKGPYEEADLNVERSGKEVENGPDIDSEDPNLSANAAEAGVEGRSDQLGMRDENEMQLDDKGQE